jgi:hypothetical protein
MAGSGLIFTGVSQARSAKAPKELPFLTVRGANIITEKGSNFNLRGPNVGGWLMWEGVMFDLVNSAEYRLRELMMTRMDTSRVCFFFDQIRQNFITESDFATIKKMGYNSIRLAFHHRYVKFDTLTELDEAIGWARNYGLYIILDCHAAPGSQNREYHADSDGRAMLWNEAEYQTEFLRLWEILAKRYKNDPTILGYELYNEPWTDDPKKLYDLSRRVVEHIRTIDERHIIFLDISYYKNPWGTLEPPPADPNLVYIFHGYQAPDKLQEYLQIYKDYQQKYPAPLMCDEFGDSTLIPLFKKNDIFNMIWAYKACYSTPGFYHMPPDNPWRRWTSGIREAGQVDKRTLRSEVLKLIQESTVSEATKRDFANSAGNLDKSTFMRIAQNHREDIPALRKIYDQIALINDQYLGKSLIASYLEMTTDQFKELAGNLQTKYFTRESNQPGSQLPPAMENK